MPKANSEKLPAPPWQVPVAVDDVPETGQHFDLVADAGMRAAVAQDCRLARSAAAAGEL